MLLPSFGNHLGSSDGPHRPRGVLAVHTETGQTLMFGTTIDTCPPVPTGLGCGQGAGASGLHQHSGPQGKPDRNT
jgi:hypothetical protein